MPDKEYRRLTRACARTAFGIVSIGRSSLWLGKDHLLSIDVTGYTESYKRFYLRDIQAIVLRKTDRWKYRALIFGACAALFGMIALAWGRTEIVAAWVFGIIGGLFGTALVVELAFGPTCVTNLRTAVQTEQLPSLGRLRKTRNVLARLRPLIATAQGQLAPEEIPARMQEWLASLAGAVPAPGSAPQYTVDEPNAPPRIVG